MRSAPCLRLLVGSFVYRIETRLRPLRQHLQLHYAGLPDVADDDCDDFWLSADIARRWLPGRSQIRIKTDQPTPLIPLPSRYAAPMLESVMNWQIAMANDRHLALHAGTVVRGTSAVLLPGSSGSGKSTLSAALMLSGWRLLSDEFGLIRLEDGQAASVVRPVSLKNRAIQIVRQRFAGARFGPPFEGLAKGTVAFLQPSEASRQTLTPAIPRLIAFPQYQEGAAFSAEPMRPSEAFLRLVQGAANYERLGETGFSVLNRLVRQTPAYALRYGCLDAAMDWIERQVVQG
ncbi:MAG: HprK-related kinase A [Rhodothalassiaceae bacterium]